MKASQYIKNNFFKYIAHGLIIGGIKNVYDVYRPANDNILNYVAAQSHVNSQYSESYCKIYHNLAKFLHDSYNVSIMTVLTDIVTHSIVSFCSDIMYSNFNNKWISLALGCLGGLCEMKTKAVLFEMEPQGSDLIFNMLAGVLGATVSTDELFNLQTTITLNDQITE